MPLHDRNRSGFTLVELMIVVAIVGILGIIAMPKFATLVRKSTEGATRAGLGVIRSALTIYYSNTEGSNPSDRLECLMTDAIYLSKLPVCDIPPYHLKAATVSNNDDLGAGLFTADAGHWFYFNDPAFSGLGSREVGEVWVGCSHVDSRNRQWTSH